MDDNCEEWVESKGVVIWWNLWVWLECIGVVIIIITFPYSTCISSFFASSVPTYFFVHLNFFFVLVIYILTLDNGSTTTFPAGAACAL